jgi:hypothetical protein
VRRDFWGDTAEKLGQELATLGGPKDDIRELGRLCKSRGKEEVSQHTRLVRGWFRAAGPHSLTYSLTNQLVINHLQADSSLDESTSTQCCGSGMIFFRSSDPGSLPRPIYIN